MVWTGRIDSLFTFCPGILKDVSSLFGMGKSEVEDRMSENISLSRCREGRWKYSAIEYWFTQFGFLLVFSIKAQSFEGHSIFRGHQVSINKE